MGLGTLLLIVGLGSIAKELQRGNKIKEMEMYNHANDLDRIEGLKNLKDYEVEQEPSSTMPIIIALIVLAVGLMMAGLIIGVNLFQDFV